MVTPAVYASSEAGRRYSRVCPPYSLYSERRFHLPSHQDIRSSTMTEREPDESSQPRKRIAVACGRCRKRKIRCSGDPGNGGPCSNCKSAGHEPCLFLRVSSTETPLRDGASDFVYNVDAGRVYHTRGHVSPHSAVPPYTGDISNSDMMSYRQSTYPYNNSKGYYSGVSGWGASTYGEDSVDYGINYSSYPHMSQDSVHMVPGYRYTSSSKSPAVYVDAETPAYSYGSLVHRPAASNDLPALSLSDMAASLPTSDRLPTISRALPSTSTYRTDGLPGHYSSSKASTSHSADLGYSNLHSNYESPATYGSTVTLPSSESSRSGHSGVAYQSSSGATDDGIYGSEQHSYRAAHGSEGYIYSVNLDNGRQESHSGSGAIAGSVLSNGQVYIPDIQSHASNDDYTATATAASTSQSGVIEGATTAAGTRGGSATSRVQAAGHRQSAGNLRGV